MKVQVLFFGATADAVGKRQIEIDLPENIRANRAFAEIRKTYPQLNDHKLLFAVNQEYVKNDEIVRNGDELAVFTAVSGG